MNCPECGEKLQYMASYDRSSRNSGGDIFKCLTDGCEEENHYFHTDIHGQLYEGKPQ
jgi:hypothetical protein